MMTDRYESAVEGLMSAAPSFQSAGRAGYHPGLETMREFDTLLGRPHESFRSIHIAGTNGKGSVAHILASVLAAKGYRTGLYTSPHLVDFRERIKIVEPSDMTGGPAYTMIPEEEVLDFLSRTEEFMNDRKPSFFEITTAMAFDWFRNERVQMVVTECGLGGRLDSTNIITPVISVITGIGYDHKDILGDTIGAIASEKAGIIKEGVPVICGRVSGEALRVIEGRAAGMGAEFRYAPGYTGAYRFTDSRAIYLTDLSSMDLQCSVQRLNLETAAAAVETMEEYGIIDEGSDSGRISMAVRTAAARTGLRGRWETLSVSPRIICDIGHNENALLPVTAQLKELCSQLKPARFYMIYGMAADKDIASVVHLLPENAVYIFTSASGSRAMPAEKLKEIITSGWQGPREDRVTGSVKEAVSLFRNTASADDLLFIGGSSYVVAEAIPLIEGEKVG